nr:cytochrome c oxidase subunit II [Notomastus sp. GK-2021]
MSPTQIGFTDPATVLMTDLIALYDLAATIGVLVFSIVSVGLLSLLFHRGLGSHTIAHAQRLEVLWTLIPGIILSLLAIPSISLLYMMDELRDPQVTVKAIGHQWYWSYEYGDFENLSYDSYMTHTPSSLRLLEVDKRLILPTNTSIRLLVTSADVIHSWAMPELAIKVDGVPGRLNQIHLLIQRPGIYRGMCSELCGVNHAFMPIVVEAIPFDAFTAWAKEAK